VRAASGIDFEAGTTSDAPTSNSMPRVSAAPVGACAVIGGGFPARLADEPDLEAVFRQRIEAQHGWQFETSWPAHDEALR
jgi:hypothetical protein